MLIITTLLFRVYSLVSLCLVCRLLIGSPKVNTSFESSIVEPGGLFSCDLSTQNPCEAYPLDRSGNRRGGVNPNAYNDHKTGQWMGVSLDATQRTNGHVVVSRHMNLAEPHLKTTSRPFSSLTTMINLFRNKTTSIFRIKTASIFRINHLIWSRLA